MTQEQPQQPKTSVGGVEVPKLKSYIERIENLTEDKEDIGADIRDVFKEAKANGFDNKAMRKVLKLRRMKANERMEEEYMEDLYKRAMGLSQDYDNLGNDDEPETPITPTVATPETPPAEGQKEENAA